MVEGVKVTALGRMGTTTLHINTSIEATWEIKLQPQALVGFCCYWWFVF